MEKQSILVVDDDDIARNVLREALKRDDFAVNGASSAEEALSLIDEKKYDLVITDVKMAGMSGIELVSAVKGKHPFIPIIVMTALGAGEVTIEAIKAGAFDFITKPIQVEKIRRIVRNALNKKDLLEKTRWREPVETFKSYTNRIIGQSEKMIEVFKLIGRVANTETTVLISGESGTGKELVARAIHENSYRRDKPFLAVNCGALPESLLESELFGYEKGAFTGADRTRIGIFEALNGGTCLLDEVGEMPLAMQAKLLRVLQDGEIRRVGSTRQFKVDIRILSATNRDLEKMVEEGKFREDLYYRLNVVTLHLPPLRERKEDIPLLIEYFLNNYMVKNRRKCLHFSEDAMKLLLNYHWAGNVRELENVIESAATLSPVNLIGPESLPPRVRVSKGEESIFEALVPLPEGDELLPLSEIERMYILKVLKAVDGNKSKAARILGLDRKTLRLKLKNFGYSSTGNHNS